MGGEVALTFKQAKKALFERFKDYGATEDMAAASIKDGIENFDMTVDGAYNITRMAWAEAIGDDRHEYFSVEDVMSITGETREECIARIEEMLRVVKESGGNPDDYALEVKPTTFYFPHGLK